MYKHFNSVFLILLFALINCDNSIIELTDANFEETVFESEDAWVILFYSSKFSFFYLLFLTRVN